MAHKINGVEFVNMLIDVEIEKRGQGQLLLSLPAFKPGLIRKSTPDEYIRNVVLYMYSLGGSVHSETTAALGPTIFGRGSQGRIYRIAFWGSAQGPVDSRGPRLSQRIQNGCWLRGETALRDRVRARWQFRAAEFRALYSKPVVSCLGAHLAIAPGRCWLPPGAGGLSGHTYNRQEVYPLHHGVFNTDDGGSILFKLLEQDRSLC
ncbi:hypothetical protein EVAR_97602_1 [Eumeta japonica]|uniref:Uncharacterized protein n=1 Tax=Eumeta variegata TaxID=151549 RepID=A0A4C1XMZ1_EUMVA|nr:hypothetical protein EVAR_97602_1 [Eumeta japonica]